MSNANVKSLFPRYSRLNIPQQCMGWLGLVSTWDDFKKYAPLLKVALEKKRDERDAHPQMFDLIQDAFATVTEADVKVDFESNELRRAIELYRRETGNLAKLYMNVAYELSLVIPGFIDKTEKIFRRRFVQEKRSEDIPEQIRKTVQSDLDLIWGKLSLACVSVSKELEKKAREWISFGKYGFGNSEIKPIQSRKVTLPTHDLRVMRKGRRLDRYRIARGRLVHSWKNYLRSLGIKQPFRYISLLLVYYRLENTKPDCESVGIYKRDARHFQTLAKHKDSAVLTGWGKLI